MGVNAAEPGFRFLCHSRRQKTTAFENCLARRLHYALCSPVPMAQTLSNHLSLAGTSLTKAVRFGCAVMRPVAISNWNKTAGAGFQV